MRGFRYEIVITIILFIVFSIKVLADNTTIENPIINPATKYCKDLGYEWSVEKTEIGEMGICRFPDGSFAQDWAFLKGREGEEWSYCKKKGYELKAVTNDTRCLSIHSADCAVCVLEGGEETEVTELMKIEGTEAVKCGNGICETDENYNNCPSDCPKTELVSSENIIYIIAFLTIIIVIVIYIARISRAKEEYYYSR